MVNRERNNFDRVRPLRRFASPIESALARRFGRSVVSTLFRVDVLVLHTSGRRSGVERDTPLAYVEREGAILVVGGAGGQAQIPDWVANLRADPSAAVTVNRDRFDVVAQELHGEQRAEVWGELTAVWPRIVAYERRAGRPVPVFRFERSRVE